MKFKLPAIFALSILLLGGCETFRGLGQDISQIKMPDFSSSGFASSDDSSSLLAPCPQVEIVEDLAVWNEFTDPTKPAQDNLVSRVAVDKQKSECTEKGRSVTVDLRLAFNGTLGPKGKLRESDRPFFTYPYFVAVTAPNGEILAKEVFAASMTYEAGETAHTHYETLRHIIPLDDPRQGGRYKVKVGFQLSQDQLAFNRNQIRLAQEAEKAREKAQAAAAKAPAVSAPAAPQPNQPAQMTVTPAQKPEGPVDITAPVE